VVFVSKDINLRIKASIAGIVSEDYENDRALDDFSLLYTGATALPEDFWQRHGKDLRRGPTRAAPTTKSRAARTRTGIRTSSSTCRATTRWR
jgi:predicted ribonuclease YlaK